MTIIILINILIALKLLSKYVNFPKTFYQRFKFKKCIYLELHQLTSAEKSRAQYSFKTD